jgi:Ca2+-transporting ATPase
MSQLGNVLALRSSRESLFQIGVTSNLAMLGALIVTLALQLVIIYVPFFQNIFDTEALTGTQLAITLAASTIVFVAVEIEKLIGRILDRNRLQHA